MAVIKKLGIEPMNLWVIIVWRLFCSAICRAGVFYYTKLDMLFLVVFIKLVMKKKVLV